MESDYTNPDTVVYSLCVEDIQSVALEELDRALTPQEIESVERGLGDWIKWDEAIVDTLRHLGICESSASEAPIKVQED